MSKYFTGVVCLECGHEMAAEVMASACAECGSQWLDARYDYEAVARLWPSALANRERSLWRYAELLPLLRPDPEITLGEGFTPLVRLYQYERMFDHPNLYIKDERQEPTSSFKDRQAALAVTALRRAGVTECVLASTGNAGAAYAAYCARAGIKLWLFLTSLVPSEKMREAALYGAEVVKVSGTYDQTKQVATEFARRRGIYMDRGAKAVPGKESMKTLGFEIAEQLGLQLDPTGQRWHSPDWYVQAVSGGIGPLGVWKGFSELLKMGLIDKMPRLGIVQASGCAPMVKAFQAGKEKADPVVPRTLIHVLATGDPGWSYQALREAVLSNNGTMLAIEDGETFAAMRRLASKAGLSVEPATAVAFAGLEKMLTDGIIGPMESVVVNCSGHTFPAESHVLGDQYVLNLELTAEGQTGIRTEDGLSAAFHSLDEQVTTILVVDDNANDRRLIRRLLRSYKSYRVMEAESGQEALKMIQDHAPDLVVTDLTMPEMDGLTLVERLKANPETSHVPVVVVSAKTLSLEDKMVLDRFSESVWTKGGFETRQLVDHIVSTLGDTPVEVIRPQLASRTPAASRSSAASETRTVVIIDDNASDVRLARRLMETSGSYRIIEAPSGREGLKSIYEYHPDLVILGLLLPDMDGFTVLETLQSDHDLRHIPIVVYSAKELTENERQHLKQHIRVIIEKTSFDKQTFVSLINDVFR
jgi:threonine synthase